MKNDKNKARRQAHTEGVREISELQSQWLRELRQTARDAKRTLRTTVYQAEVVILSIFLPLSLARDPQAHDRERLLLTALFGILSLTWGTATLIFESRRASRQLSQEHDRIDSGQKGILSRERFSPMESFCSTQFLFFAVLSLIALYTTVSGEKFHFPINEFLSWFRRNP